ncbi:hypothetical protein EZS27_027362, partial [termite gut metagenome]
MNKKLLTITCCFLVFLVFIGCSGTRFTDWPKVNIETKPATRWWWLGSAVDKANLTHNLETYAAVGIGTVEITPIYGVLGNDSKEISFLSEKWMEMLKHTEAEATRLGMQIDMNTGTGWPFGGPEVKTEDAASKLFVSEYSLEGGRQLSEKIEVGERRQKPHAVLSRLMAFSNNGECLDLTSKVNDDGILQWEAPQGSNWKLIAAFCGKTLQQVKRAAPGGEGYVMDHLSARAVKNYLGRFDRAFAETTTTYPHSFFNDSYEVYDADWTEDFFDQFAVRREYKLEDHLPQFLSKERTDETARIISDYRETMAELIYENFTAQWTNWAHSHKTITRNQAHGSPGNLIDLYATVDVPECESFGLSNFDIHGLRKDSLTRRNDSDLSMLKYASSAAHIAGKPYTSAETFTWLTEHFRTSLSHCKPDLDLMFVSGVNHVFFHGTAYSPAEAEGPGWKFYASMDMSPTNNIWRDAPALFSYITRCQSFLQSGKPDNDFLVYVPIYDIWQEQDGRLLVLDIHKMAQRAPKFINAVQRIYNAGYDMDYISDNFIRTAHCVDGQIQTSGGTTYKALIILGVHLMPDDVLAKLFALVDEGATIVFLEQFPEDVPGYANLNARRASFKQIIESVHLREGNRKQGRILFGTDYIQTLAMTGVRPETMNQNGLSSIRRTNLLGHHYFISALKTEDTEDWIPISVPAASAMFFDPMTGKSGKARLRQTGGYTEVYMQLTSGQSIILRTFAKTDVEVPAWEYWKPQAGSLTTDSIWDIHFVQSEPQIDKTFSSTLGSWTALDVPEAKINMGTGCYATNFTLKDET